MRKLSDADIGRLITIDDAIDTVDAAFRSFAAGEAAMQARIRTDAGGIKLSTLGAVLPQQGHAGAKVYTTIAGRFNFVIVLFSTVDGRPLATLDAGALTGLRTAAASAVAARSLARPESSVLAVFGTGVQAHAHVIAMTRVMPVREVRVVSRGDAAAFIESIRGDTGLKVHAMEGRAALAGADIVITATRSVEPVLRGDWIAPGIFIAAIGSSRPDSRELDDRAIARCDSIVVEWTEQVRHEAGDLVMAGNLVDWDRVRQLGDVISGRVPGRQSASEIILYKSVGVGLEDIALAGLAYRKAVEHL